MAAALAVARPWRADARPAIDAGGQATPATTSQAGPGVALYPHLFSPLTFRNLTVKNRVFRSNIAGRFDNYDGSGNQARINWEVKFARGGVGAIISSFVPVTMRGRIMPNYATIDRDACTPFWKRLVEQVHGESDCKYILQLSHGGRQRDVPGIEYAKGLSSTDKNDPLHGFECERATVEQIREIVQAFAPGSAARSRGRRRRRRTARRQRLSDHAVPQLGDQRSQRRLRWIAREPRSVRHRDRARDSRSRSDATSTCR